MRYRKKMKYLYRCGSEGPINNGLKPVCEFEMEFEEGTHNCPICGHPLMRVSSGPTVSEVLRRGQQLADRHTKGTKK